VVTAMCGGSETSKNTLMKVLHQTNPEAIVVYQSAICQSSRSTLANYSGLMDRIRVLFARSTGENKSLFSFNSDGGCPACGGRGVTFTDLAFMESIKSVCEVCHGKRYSKRELQHRFR